MYLQDFALYGLYLPSYILLNHIKIISTKRLVFKINDGKDYKKKNRLVPSSVIRKIKTAYIEQIIE